MTRASDVEATIAAWRQPWPAAYLAHHRTGPAARLVPASSATRRAVAKVMADDERRLGQAVLRHAQSA